MADTTDWSWLSPLLGGVGSLATSGLRMNDAGRAAGMADPFSGERPAYQGQLRDYMGTNSVNPQQVTAGSQNSLGMLMNLLQNPGSLTSMPGYQFGLNQALEGVNRGAGASGLLNSGNRLAALQDRGQSYAQGWQQQMYNELLGNVQANNSVANLGLNAQGQGFNELANLSGVNAGSPTAAAQALLNGRSNQLGSIGSGIGGIANGLAGGGISALQRMMNTGGSTSATPGIGGGTDNWDLMGNQSAYGLGGGATDNWDLMGDSSAYGLGGSALENFDWSSLTGPW